MKIETRIVASFAALLACGLVASASACRAVVGIEPVELVDGGSNDGGSGDGSKGDSGGGDAGGGSVCKQATSAECFKCCRDTYQQPNGAFEGAMRQTGCACSSPSGTCKVECATSACASPPQPPSGPDSCVPCLDGLIKSAVSGASSSCAAALQQCTGNTNCSPVATCFKACPQQ